MREKQEAVRLQTKTIEGINVKTDIERLPNRPQLSLDYKGRAATMAAGA